MFYVYNHKSELPTEEDYFESFQIYFEEGVLFLLSLCSAFGANPTGPFVKESFDK